MNLAELTKELDAKADRLRRYEEHVKEQTKLLAEKAAKEAGVLQSRSGDFCARWRQQKEGIAAGGDPSLVIRAIEDYFDEARARTALSPHTPSAPPPRCVCAKCIVLYRIVLCSALE